jgi:2-polyprenyl-6-hydroxyphenyl methylase/3-demethylubiquinone-9 3-methyltransferase
MAFIKEKVGLHFKIPENALKPFQGLRILDVGCGGGILCEPLARLGAEVVGIDPVEESIEVARNHAAQMNLSPTYLPYSVEDLPEDLPLFDVIIASEIIEHVPDPHHFIEACTAHLKPSGGMFLSTFNKTLKSYLLGIVAAEYVLGWAPRGTHSWDQFISPQDLSRLLSSRGLGQQELSGVAFSPFKREWAFSSSTDVNYFLWAGRGEALS